MSLTAVVVTAALIGLAGISASAALVPVAGGTVKAADLSRFDPGNIISDEAFFNSSTMSAQQIQDFLNSKVSACQAGYTCLKDFRQTTSSLAASKYCNGYAGAPSESAAMIIYKVAVSCGINPQVLLVTLQKEQGLVTHTWPSDWRYTIAMGQGCPDTAACDTLYYGFQNQVYGAARQFEIYREGKYFTYYAPGHTWNVLYNPNRDCGSSPVYIANAATAGLYYYTPYQPNAAALRAGYGEGDGCSSYGNRNFYNYYTDWFGAPPKDPNSPIGFVEEVKAVPGAFTVAGWAADPNSAEPIGVHVYVSGVGYPFVAELYRADVAARYPSLGGRHGFTVTVPVTAEGPNDVCIYGINVGAGGNWQMSCTRVTAMAGSPFGTFEAATPADGGLTVTGWAIDPDTTAPIDVHVYVDGVGTPLTTGDTRTDVATAYPPYGANHGFSRVIGATPGSHQVCAYGINVGLGGNVELGCRTITVPVTVDAGRAPIGALDAVTAAGPVVSALGWAIDPDTALPIRVRVESSGIESTTVADSQRPDVGAAYPRYGAGHGFTANLTLSGGTHEVCVYALNGGAGGDTKLGCRTITIPVPDLGRAPIGVIDSVSVTGATANVTGWALDLDTTASLSVHIYVGSVGIAYTADKSRPDVGAAYPLQGAMHGFSEGVSVPPGHSDLCVYAINTGAGGNSLLGCRGIDVADHARPPIGNLENVGVAPGAVTAAGWALDPDTSASIPVHVYVDGVGSAFTADLSRPDVAAGYPGMGDRHGFSVTVPASPGMHTVCVYPINDAPGPNTLLGCWTVAVP
jgi:hypothetical protein